ncbi:MAG: hypothetical protein RR710_03040 [Oscillospiraceae bacterium]
MYYHASQVGGLKELFPHISNHEKPLVYLSFKRENVLVYLSNAVEKHCKEIGFKHSGYYKKWGSYGFQKGILCLDEYYPNATIDTYKGVSGYIYSSNNVNSIEKLSDIPFAFTTTTNVSVEYCEFIPDAYDAIMQAAEEGKIILRKYEDNSEKMLDWIKTSIKNEYDTNENHLEYQSFIRAKFDDILHS